MRFDLQNSILMLYYYWHRYLILSPSWIFVVTLTENVPQSLHITKCRTPSVCPLRTQTLQRWTSMCDIHLTWRSSVSVSHANFDELRPWLNLLWSSLGRTIVWSLPLFWCFRKYFYFFSLYQHHKNYIWSRDVPSHSLCTTSSTGS